MTEVIEWSDQIGSRGRSAYLLVVDAQGGMHKFVGQSIRGILAVMGKQYKKAGKWSHTMYRLRLGDGVRAIPCRAGWETGTMLEGLGAALGARIESWDDLASAIGVPREEAERFFRANYAATAATLDEIAEALSSLG